MDALKKLAYRSKNTKTEVKVKKTDIKDATRKVNKDQRKLDQILKKQTTAVNKLKQGDKKNLNIHYFNLATDKCEHFQATIQAMLNKETFFDVQEDAVTQIKEAAMACAEAILKMRYGPEFSIEASEQTMDMPDAVPKLPEAMAQKITRAQMDRYAQKIANKQTQKKAVAQAVDPTEEAALQKEKADSKQAVTDSKKEPTPTSVSTAEVLFANLHADNRYKWNL